jgi:GH43 family beta-xylosidase
MKYVYVIIIIISCIDSTSQTILNPIQEQADPYILHTGCYYYYLGTAGDKIDIRKSTTLEGLKTSNSQTIFSGIDMGPKWNYWAPKLYCMDNKWYIYYTASNRLDNITSHDSKLWIFELTSGLKSQNFLDSSDKENNKMSSQHKVIIK